MKREKSRLCLGLCLLALFLLWTWAVQWVDVAPIGPEGTSVGFAALNGPFHQLTGVHWGLYTLTDWLGLVPFAVAGGFGILGLVQLCKRKSLLRVDGDILALGVFYLLVIGVYLLFEEVVLNYRPVLVEGQLEASYPSSTTLLTLCVMLTAAGQLRRRISSPRLRTCLAGLCWAFALFMVVGRLLSGVHWLSDIIGGALCSGGLVVLYGLFLKKEPAKK